MTELRQSVLTAQTNWQHAAELSDLERTGVKLVRFSAKQIVLYSTPEGVMACDNRCPHEGYPLAEGSLSPDCTLTCNWHNWKFNLRTGENLYGGDRLRVYPVEIRGAAVWIDIADPPYATQYRQILHSLQDAFDDYSYDRIAREIARLTKLGADPLDALRAAIDWSWQKLEFGWTHAYAGMADWLILYEEYADDTELRLVCLVESVAHVAYDVLRETEYPYSEALTPFDADRFLRAIEDEDEATAVAAIRGGLRDGLDFADFEPALTRAALAHYNDFGHALIYVSKIGGLIDRLGQGVAPALLLSLVREIVFASREDKIPEFRAYAEYANSWGRGEQIPEPGLWRHQGINKSLQAAVDCSSATAAEIYRALLVANVINLLSYDISQQDKIRISVSGNVGWLDFTHGVTFAAAVRQQCSRFPELWPQGLLQMACFNGRNAGFTVDDTDLAHWHSTDFDSEIEALIKRVFDHGQGEHIVSVHLLKTALAARAEAEPLDAADADLLLAAVTRFFNSPLKRRQPRRTAYQSLQFVAKE